MARVLALALLVCRAAEAEVLPWQGSLRFEWLWFEPMALHGAGVATLAGDGAGLRALRLSGGIQGSDRAPMLPGALGGGVRALDLSAELGTGTLSLGASAGAAGPARRLPIRGIERICYFVLSCASALPLPLVTPAAAQGLGLGGLITFGDWSPLRISVYGAPWTPGTASLPLPTSAGGSFPVSARGWVHGPWSLTGSTGLPGGSLSLVTPMRVTSTETLALTGFARLSLRFVPEPEWPLLILPGSLGLWSLGRRRAARSHPAPPVRSRA